MDNRTKILKLIEKLWEKYPELTFSALIEYITLHSKYGGYELKDEDLIKDLEDALKNGR